MRIIRGRVLILSGIMALLATTAPVHAVTQTQNRDINVSGVVLGPPPATPPTITSPEQGQTFTEKTVAAKGDCIAGLIVRIFRNAIFAGSAMCDASNNFTMQMDLTEGRNDLIARQYDANNQSSPDSDTVTAFFAPHKQQPALPDPTPQTPGAPVNTPPAGPPSTQVAQFQLIIDYDYSFQGVTVNKPLNLPIHFLGGTPPYAVSVSWNDGQQSVISRENAEQFFVEHTYTKAGTYIVKLRVSDKNGNQAFLQFVLIVNGKLAETPNAALFGVPITFDAFTYMAVPSFAFGAAGFAAGFFAHRWKRVRTKRNNKNNNSALNS
jgi:hypothetical protein